MCSLFLVLACVIFAKATSEISTPVQAMMYLQRFGYMDQTKGNSASLLTEETVINSIKDFQRFAGLNETGILDNQTFTMMNMPRCGVKDRVGHGESARRKRYTLQGSRWRVTNLTYKISKYPKRLKDRQKVDKEIARAFKVWSDMTPLSFTVRKSGRVHIDVRFESGEHGDGDPFDGPGKTLAHAFFPQYGGDAHFDDEEKWTINEYQGTNLFQVAAHEFGHSLGLSHSDVKSSLMAPFYRGYQAVFQLDEDDVLAIQALYGDKKEKPERPTTTDKEDKPKPKPDDGDAPDLCQDGTIDAITKTEDGNTYVFKGDYYWHLLEDGIADGYPRRISDDWSGLPGNLDAALTWTDGKTFFFKKGQYWRFRNKIRSSGYPKSISVGFMGIPYHVDAAFVWSGNGKTYFFKGNEYWRFDSRSDPPVSDRYPRPISNWNGLPDKIDAAFQWKNGRTYFFSGKNYYRFNDRTFAIDSSDNPYPRSTATWWFDCRSISQTQPRSLGLTVDTESVEEDDRKLIPVGSNDGGGNYDYDWLQNGNSKDASPMPKHSPQRGDGGDNSSSENFASLLSTVLLLCGIFFII